MLIYFNNNLFYAGSIHSLQQFLKTIGPEQVGYLRHISLKYDPGRGAKISTSRRAVRQLLSDLEGALTKHGGCKLELTMADDRWFPVFARFRARFPDDDASKIPGLSDISRTFGNLLVTKTKLVLHSAYPKIKKYLLDEIAALKA